MAVRPAEQGHPGLVHAATVGRRTTLVDLLHDAIGFPHGSGAPRPPVRTPHGGIAAFFDVDNTLVHGATLFYLARALCSRRYFSRDDLLRFVRHQVRCSALGERPDSIEEARERALGLLAGHDAATLAQVAEQVYRDVLTRRLYPGTLEMLEAHRSAGHEIWLVTATPIEIGELLAEHLGATGCLATVAERVDGHYTGRLVGEPMHGRAKARAVVDLAERTGLDLAGCYAYGDSASDLAMLGAVGHPVAINPDARLRRVAASRHWPRYEFRTRRRAVVRTGGALALTAAAWWTVDALRSRRG